MIMVSEAAIILGVMAASCLQPSYTAVVQIDSRRSEPVPSSGSFYQRGLATLQVSSGNSRSVLRCSSLLAISGRLQQCEPVEVSAAGISIGKSLRERQEPLWRDFFLDPRLWWDHRQHKNSPRSPDFRHKESKEVLWLNSFWKPAWVDERLAALDSLLGTSSLTLPNTSGPGRVADHRSDVSAESVSKLCDRGDLGEAVDALSILVHRKSPVSTSLFYLVLKSCVAHLELARRVDQLIVKAGHGSDTFLANNILRMYASHGRLQEAKDVFTRVAKPDVFTWSAVIGAHAKLGKPQQAIKLYQQMRSYGVEPASHVFVAALQACARAADLISGRQVHANVLESTVEPNLFIWNCLVDMYAKCGRLDDARKIFDSLVTRDVVTWNAMIAGYAEHEQGREALSLYARMEQEGSFVANTVTFACLLKACTNIGDLQQGKQLHSQVKERGLECDVFVGTCLVDMYAKCGMLEESRRIFDSLTTKNVVTWTAMIAGYAEHDFGQKALALYAKMEHEGVISADAVTFACLLKACTNAAALQQGKQLHVKIRERQLEAEVVLGNCLVDMYAKCGKLDDARRVFENLPTKDVVTWNAMINGFGQNNNSHEAIECFMAMMQAGVLADETTFTCLLTACSHGGLAKEGQQFFKAMVEDCGIMPTVEHCNCMVDLLGRAGYLDEAEKMLLTYKCDHVGLTSLLNACRDHGNVELGMRCFKYLMRSDSQNATAYVLMGNMYADAGRWSDVEKIESLRKKAGAIKKPAVAGIEVDRHVHTFVVGEVRKDIPSKVRSVSTRLKEEGGHVPHTELVLKQLSHKRKEDELCGHAEKLALAYGLMNTPDGTPLLVTKNLRMCGDCHSSTEIMSRIEKREIIVRDVHRVHRFADGSCHCGGRP